MHLIQHNLRAVLLVLQQLCCVPLAVDALDVNVEKLLSPVASDPFLLVILHQLGILQLLLIKLLESFFKLPLHAGCVSLMSLGHFAQKGILVLAGIRPVAGESAARRLFFQSIGLVIGFALDSGRNHIRFGNI
ncbi:hypothetical protein PG994_015100 [Apiospora phragmitis]|uniref:Secreted protein n=1 Tax=Apiospora phragmitis TaxID=2905665 RepID=A0ABR1SVJ6_9PEZI